MKTLKEFLAFPLLATVVWLVGVLANQTGHDGVMNLLIALLLLTAAAWLYGKTTERRVPKVSKWSLIVVFSLLATFLISGLSKMRSDATAQGANAGMRIHAPWKAWNAEALAAALKTQKTVVVNITADWCVTCKVNEAVVLDREIVREKLGSDSVVALMGDWTNGDAKLTDYMALYGRNSVPVYLVYRNGNPEPKILSQILSVDSFLKELE